MSQVNINTLVTELRTASTAKWSCKLSNIYVVDVVLCTSLCTFYKYGYLRGNCMNSIYVVD